MKLHLCANILSKDERRKVVACLVEGNSLRATTRMTGVHRTTIMKLLNELGEACQAYQDTAPHPALQARPVR
ncbi:MAG: uncharacterized protein JWO94_678 [Verrucomicrobiaceae bacterium]|nr:uncharacterized protein [Verrucomicrobiaceae bacterium]